MKEVNVKIVHGLIKELFDKTEGFYLENKSESEPVEDYLCEWLEDHAMQSNTACAAIRWLSQNEINSYEDALTFEEEFGGIPLIDCVMEDVLGVDWQIKVGIIAL